GARVHLAAVRRQVPRHLNAAWLMAKVARAEASWEEAWNALHEVLALDPENQAASRGLPELCRDAAEALHGKPEVAATWLRRLAGLRPDDLDVLADLAATLARAGLHGDAADTYHELGERSQYDPRWPTFEGVELRLSGRLAEAETALLRARQLAPEDGQTALALAQLAEQTDKPEEAYAAAMAALRLVPDKDLELADAPDQGPKPMREATRIALHSALRLAERARVTGDMNEVARHLEHAAKLDPRDPQLWRSLGEARRLAGDGIGAAAAFARLWEVCPEDLEAAFIAAELFRGAGDLPTARQLYLGILERDAGHRETLLTLARLLWQEEDRSGARWYLGRVLASLDEGPDDPDMRPKLLAMLAAIAWQEGAFTECFDRAGEAMALAPGDATEFKQARGLRLRAAQKLATLADHEENPAIARKWWGEVARLDPADRVAFRRLADLAMHFGEAEEATRMFRVLWDTDPTDVPAALRLAEGLIDLGRRDDARQAFEEAVARTHAPQAAVGLARLAHEDADPEAAWRWAEHALKHQEAEATKMAEFTEPRAWPGSDPHTTDEDESAFAARRARLAREAQARRDAREIAGDAALQLALRAQDAGNREQEALWWARLAELDVTGRDRLLPLARGQARSGDPAAAAGTLLRLWEEDPTDIAVAQELAETLLAAGDLEGALINYRRVADLAEGRPELATRREAALLELARLCAAHKRPEEAWEYSQALLAMRPDHAEARDLSATCALDLAEAAEAEQDFDSALLYRQVYMALRPGDREGILKLAGLHLAADRRDQAVALYHDLLTRRPGDTEARLCLADALRGDQPEVARGHYEDVLAKEPRNLHALVSLADLVESWREFELAYALRARSAEAADDPVPHWLGQARLAWRLERIEEAWAHVQQIFERVPSHPQAVELGSSCCRRLAMAAQDRGEVRVAREHWEALLDILPADIEAVREVGRIARETGDLDAAQDSFTRAMALDPADKASAYQVGLLKLARRDVDGARHTFASILERDPQHRETLLAMAELAWNDGDPEGAWYHTQELLALDPSNARGLALFTDLARTFAARTSAEGDHKTAVEWWTLAHKQVPRDSAVLRSLAEARVRVGDLDGAAEGYTRLMDYEPDDIAIAHRAADIFRQLGAMPRAENALRRVVELDPRHIPSLRLLMAMARERGDAKDVMARAYDILDQNPQDPEAMFELAWAHNALLEKKAALQTYEELLEGDPHHAEGWNQVAQLHRDLGELEPARKAATNAIVYGARPDYHVTLGSVYARLGQWDEAVAAFGQALNLDPDHPDARAQLGFALLQQRKPDQAKGHLEKAFLLLPADSDAALEVRCALDLL
ncbi:MAG: tetratricopeptide repeat protein, partial [Candidatus Sericytochromatia bacterium]|nr:tetratricopeptide repeat protein [Candidatus Tanganyikabacteria bacterium]